MKKLIMGNWKMNGCSTSIKELCQSISKVKYNNSNICVVVFPASIYAKEVIAQLPTTISVGLQNISFYDNGSYTGEISSNMLKDIGCSYLLIGHSERRLLFGEMDEDIFRKLAKVIDTSITPVLCIGESLRDRQSGKLEQILANQLNRVLHNLLVKQLSKVVIAYEPVWAIGTDVVATLKQIEEAHSCIRHMVANVEPNLASNIKIVYGGSLKATNAQDILSLDGVDGGLIGGASLQASEFNEIINQADKICMGSC